MLNTCRLVMNKNSILDYVTHHVYQKLAKPNKTPDLP